MKFLYIVNKSSFFCSHFYNLALEVSKRGHTVHVAAGDDESRLFLENNGFVYHNFTLSRSSVNPFRELLSIISLYNVIKKVSPDLMHMFTIKPIIYGGFINKLFFKKTILAVTSVTGLGTASLNTSFTGRLIWLFIKKLYKFILSPSNVRVIFENSDDLNEFVSHQITPNDKTFIVNGAGVDTVSFSPVPNKPSQFTVVLVARLLKDKGIREYIQAGEILKNSHPEFRLVLVGSIDAGNPSSMVEDEIIEAHNKGFVDYLGQRSDVANIYQNAHVACLPSYREGLPKSLIEAISCGLPVITTDVPGCRQMIHNGRTGIIVPPKNSSALADAILNILSNDKAFSIMCSESRNIALERYGHDVILDSFLKVYNLVEVFGE